MFNFLKKKKKNMYVLHFNLILPQVVALKFVLQ